MEKFSISLWEILSGIKKLKKKLKSQRKLWQSKKYKSKCHSSELQHHPANLYRSLSRKGQTGLYFWKREGLAGSALLPPRCSAFTSPGVPASLPSACSGETQRPHADLTHGIRRSAWIYSIFPWNYEFDTLKPFIFCCLFILLYETLQLFPARAKAELFESGKLVFFTISHPKALMFSIPSPTTVMYLQSIWWG